MKVQDIMKTTVTALKHNPSVLEACKALDKENLNGAPVIDDNNKIIGVITKADLFKAILPRYPDIHEDERYLMDFEYIEERIDKLQKIDISAIMGTPPLIVEPDTPIIRAGSLMLLRRVKQLPVMDGEKLVGIVSFTDIIKAFIKKYA